MRERLTRSAFEERHGAASVDLERVASFAREHELQVTETNRSRRVVEVRGTIAQFSSAFEITFYRYDTPLGSYRGYQGTARVPKSLSAIVETIVGLDNRPLPVRHMASDPSPIGFLTPQQVANLYHFPPGAGQGETIGIYAAVSSEGSPGYTASDLTATMIAFGGSLVAPIPTDISIGGQANAGVSTKETVLDIAVSSAIAQSAAIVVYFTANSVQDTLQCIQRMVHPSSGDPIPTIISISYGWGPDDQTDRFTDDEYQQFSTLFQDAANLNISVLVASGDTGAMYKDSKIAQVSYPASDPWVLACGGTSVGNMRSIFGSQTFDEFVWNDTWPTSGGATKSGATGGGISARFAIPSYQVGITLPKHINTGKTGRGVPDVAGNASPNSGYPLVVNGKSIAGEGGTSAVAPLYAGLFAIINSILRDAGFLHTVGFANWVLYDSSYNSGALVCRDVTAATGPTNNNYGSVTGYNAGIGWDACTGLGSIDGEELLNAFYPLAVVIHRRTSDGCDPGPVSRLTATFDANVTGGFGLLTYKWTATNAKIVGPDHFKHVIVRVPTAGTEFQLSVRVTSFGHWVKGTGNYKALTPTMAELMHSLCKLIRTMWEFKPPIYINPGDPYLPAELQRINSYAKRIAELSGRLLELPSSRSGSAALAQQRALVKTKKKNGAKQIRPIS